MRGVSFTLAGGGHDNDITVLLQYLEGLPSIQTTIVISIVLLECSLHGHSIAFRYARIHGALLEPTQLLGMVVTNVRLTWSIFPNAAMQFLRHGSGYTISDCFVKVLELDFTQFLNVAVLVNDLALP